MMLRLIVHLRHWTVSQQTVLKALRASTHLLLDISDFFSEILRIAALIMDKEQRKKEMMNPKSLEKRQGTVSGQGKIPVVKFDAKAAMNMEPALRNVGKCYNLSYQMGRSSSILVRDLLTAHGFKEGQGSGFNLMWRGPNIDSGVYKNLASFHKVNHFPNSNELGRKDLLCRNLKKLQKKSPSHAFDFMPETYVLPEDYDEFREAFCTEPGLFIKKPVASSQGHGIKIIKSLAEVSRKDKAVLSRYIQCPLLLDGYKFDLRIYVLVTSYNPLVIYLYEDGLTRIATEKYDLSFETTKDKFMHLTNTSLNMKSSKYVMSKDEAVEDCGNRWSLSAMLRLLKETGRNTAALMSKIEDIVIKTIISAEKPIADACAQSVPHRNNCFELYGFDILIDRNMKPWLLEVNVSPSLSCYDPMDLKVKTHLVADTLTLVGVQCKNSRDGFVIRGINSEDARIMKNPWQIKSQKAIDERMKIFQCVEDEQERTGGFIRIFPTFDSWKTYGSLLLNQTTNQVLHSVLFSGKEINDMEPGKNIQKYERLLPPLTKKYNDRPGQIKHQDKQMLPPVMNSNRLLQRSEQYERELPTLKNDTNNGPRKIIDNYWPLTLRNEVKPFPSIKQTPGLQTISSTSKQAAFKKDFVKAPASHATQKLPPLNKASYSGLRENQAPGTNKTQYVGRPVISANRKNGSPIIVGRAAQTQDKGKPVSFLERQAGKDLGDRTQVVPVHHSPETRTGPSGFLMPATPAFLRPKNEWVFSRVNKIVSGFSEFHKQASAEN